MIPLFSLLAGVVFGVGLAVADMVNPARVLSFLDVAGHWDPTLLFVMAGAIPIAALGYRLAFAIGTPLIGGKFRLPSAKQIDFALVGGSVLFGVGWGLAGVCPGPAFADLVTLQPNVILFVGALIAGMLTAKSWPGLMAVLSRGMHRSVGKTVGESIDRTARFIGQAPGYLERDQGLRLGQVGHHSAIRTTDV